MKRICRIRRRPKPLAALLLLVVSMANGQSQITLDPGSTALQKGDYKGAEAFYRKALVQSPKSPEVLSNLGIALQMQGKSSEAIRAFERALTRKQMPRTYALLAEEKCETRDVDGARPMLARITREYFQDPSILAVIAPCYLELDDPIESVRVYESLLTYHAYPTDLALIQLAKSYLKAAQFFFGRLSRAPGSAIYISAIREARDKGSPNARGAFDAAAKASPYFQPDLDFSDAVARWREHPQDTALLYLLVVLSSEQSMRHVEICDDTYPNSPYLAQLQAEILADQGHDDEAVARYESLMQAHPELPNLLYDLGMLFRKEREWEQALVVFQKQLAKEPDDEGSAARISEALIQLERWKELSAFLSTRVGATDPPLWAMLDFAEASRNMDQPGRAITVLASAEKAYPSDKSVHYRLMLLYRQMGNAAQSKKELEQFRALSK
ncbi:MAG: tetratricopeptide repeat protein [Acidobacteriaceae bacterium]